MSGDAPVRECVRLLALFPVSLLHSLLCAKKSWGVETGSDVNDAHYTSLVPRPSHTTFFG